MKTYFIILLLTLSQVAHSADVPISIQDLGAKVKKQNLLVLEEVEKVYQAKQAIRVARTNLLPKLNLWRLIGGATGNVVGLLGLVEDLVPFLVPGNWLRLNQQNLFYDAEKKAERALRANQVFNAKNLYYQALSDLGIYELIKDNLKCTKDVIDYVKVQEQFGQIPQGASELLEIRALAYQDDLNALDQMIYEERQTLSKLAGLPTRDLLQLVAVTKEYPRVPLQKELIQKKAITLSPEIAQFDDLIEASYSVRREAYFSLLGVSSLSRGVAGGIFDSYPLQEGLGFGMGPSVLIGRSYTRQIEIQKIGVRQTLERQIQATVNGFNIDLNRFENAKQRKALAEELYNLHIQRLMQGQVVSALDLIEALQQKLDSRTDFLMVDTRMRQTIEKVERLTFETVDYSTLR